MEEWPRRSWSPLGVMLGGNPLKGAGAYATYGAVRASLSTLVATAYQVRGFRDVGDWLIARRPLTKIVSAMACIALGAGATVVGVLAR